MLVQKTQGRSQRGASTIALILILAFFVLLPLGVLGYEITRGFLVQQELRNVCDSAALSGSAAMASAPTNVNYQTRQQDAMDTAFQTFEMNSILQTPLNTGNVSCNQNPQPPGPSTPAVHHATINLVLLDQNGNQVTLGTPAASMTCQAYWTDAPVWGPNGILPILSQYTISSSSNGGLPQLDIIACYDISGSMDDQTPVRFVNRFWDVSSGTGKLNWKTNVTSNGNAGYPSGTNNTMYSELQLTNVGSYTGTALNVCPPENLDLASYQGSGANGVSFLWSETQPVGGFTFSHLNGLRSNGSVTGFSTLQMPEAGMPPGNCRPGQPNYTTTSFPSGQWKGLANTSNDPTSQDSSGGFTDMVVDMGWDATGQNQSGYPWSGTVPANQAPPSMNFGNAQTAVEAARGNLENANVLCSAYGYPSDTSLTKKPVSLPNPSSGYFTAYWSYVLNNASPISPGRQALYNFFNTMNISSNCHLGLICFSDSPGTSSSSTYTATNDNIDNTYSTGGTGTFLNPGITINSSDAQATDYNAVLTAIDGSTNQPPETWTAPTSPLASQTPVVPQGATDISDSLASALYVLSNGSTPAPSYPMTPAGSARQTAKKAVVLFTDGVPNIPGGQGPASTAALAQASIAGGTNVSIPIYTIGLAANPDLSGPQNALLSTPNGIAGLSGNNAIYVPIANAAGLETAFQTIARSLCELQ